MTDDLSNCNNFNAGCDFRDGQRFKQAAGTLQWLYQERLPQSVNAENYDDLRNFDFPQFGG
jgi:hypothetical protein